MCFFILNHFVFINKKPNLMNNQAVSQTVSQTVSQAGSQAGSVKSNPRPNREIIRRSVYGGKYCYIEMYDDDETFGWHWDYFDGKTATFGAQGNFPGVTASEKVKEEIKSRNWTGNMSIELEALAKELWRLFEIEKKKFR